MLSSFSSSSSSSSSASLSTSSWSRLSICLWIAWELSVSSWISWSLGAPLDFYVEFNYTSLLLNWDSFGSRRMSRMLTFGFSSITCDGICYLLNSSCFSKSSSSSLMLMWSKFWFCCSLVTMVKDMGPPSSSWNSSSYSIGARDSYYIWSLYLELITSSLLFSWRSAGC